MNQCVIGWSNTSKTNIKDMKYGIYITKQIFDVYEDGSRQLVNTRTGWLGNYEYDMKSAKSRLKAEKESLNELKKLPEKWGVQGWKTFCREKDRRFASLFLMPLKMNFIKAFHQKLLTLLPHTLNIVYNIIKS